MPTYLSELENNTGKFPRLALERAIEERETITPLLLATLEKWKNNLEELLEQSDYILHIYALYLLAQFREPLAYPLIIEFFSVPGELSVDVTGDVVTEDLGRILASVSQGNIEPLKELIENQEVNRYVRSAALRALLVLVTQGIISRETVIQYFQEIFSTKLGKEPDFIWTNLVITSVKLCPIELKQYIDRAFEFGLIEPFFINQDNVDSSIQLGQEAALQQLRERSRYSLIEDSISEIENWACFRQEKAQKSDKSSLVSKGFAISAKPVSEREKKKTRTQKPARQKNRSKKK